MPTQDEYTNVRQSLRQSRTAVLMVLVNEPDDTETQLTYQQIQAALSTWERNLPDATMPNPIT